MKSADKIIRTLRLLPEVYSDKSRDFLVFTRLMDAIYNSSMYNTTTMKHIWQPDLVKADMLLLMADMFGISEEDANSLTEDELRIVLQCLPYLLRYKGSLKAVDGLINIFFKLHHILGEYTVSISNEETVMLGIKLTPRTIIVGLNTISKSADFMNILAKYLLPPGYAFYVYFYSPINVTSRDFFEKDKVTLLYRSNNIVSQIDLEIPDFIIGENRSIISAIDFSSISNSATMMDKDYFLGFCDSSFLTDEFITNYNNAQAYDSSTDYNHHDIAKFTEGNSTVYKMFVVEKPLGLSDATMSSAEWIREHGSWRIIEANKSIIIEDVIWLVDNIGDDKHYMTGRPSLYLGNKLFGALNFFGSFTETQWETEQSKSHSNLDFCCVMPDTTTPVLYRTGETPIILADRGIVYNMPTASGSENDLVYCKELSQYLVYLNGEWQPCSEGSTINEQSPSVVPAKDMLVWWKRNGKYYIKLNSNWVEYTQPLFLVEIMTRGRYLNE